MELTEIFEGNTSVKDLLVLTLIQKAIPMRQFELIRYKESTIKRQSSPQVQ